MKTKLSALDRRNFLRGVGGFALALPAFETFSGTAAAAENISRRKRLACFYLPNGVPMPRKDDPAYEDWSWFPQGSGKNFKLSKCLDPLEPLREQMTVFSGLSHPAVRNVHGHSNADQFLTGADTGGSGDYKNSISMDQMYAAHVGEQTRVASLVMSTDGGAGTPRGAHTMSFAANGRAIPAENKPKRIFDTLFVKDDGNAARRLSLNTSALDELMGDAQSLRKDLSKYDQRTFDQFLDSVRSTELKVEKAARWIDMPLPTVDVDHLNLDITPNDPREYVQTMYELIYLAFHTDSTRVATYMIGKELGAGISDYLAKAVGLPLTHKLSHQVKTPGGWKNFGTYCRFISEEHGRFLTRLKSTPEPGGDGSMLDNTLCLFGSASSAFHLSRNYPLILAGGGRTGIRHGQYLQYGSTDLDSISGMANDNIRRVRTEEDPMGRLLLTMLQQLGVETNEFAGCNQVLPEMLA
ncbi:hypothetical protein Q31b_04830 [Novipirellula aureliae]|uniref:DUF1552 domain-containing protein n=1 Tax=Novipirellula aureliae TaxID=2527966 RepID=A0A5C6EC16_9BACT|nr:DUF1552 domain-containing protein [Novipirellula aureliae]TWU45311.1 hypothetical protein Q31b_04830 [Novipirellula aureliae]